MAQTLNREILKTTVGLMRRKLGMRDFQLWSFIPTAVSYFGPNMGGSWDLRVATFNSAADTPAYADVQTNVTTAVDSSNQESTYSNQTVAVVPSP